MCRGVKGCGKNFAMKCFVFLRYTCSALYCSYLGCLSTQTRRAFGIASILVNWIQNFTNSLEYHPPICTKCNKCLLTGRFLVRSPLWHVNDMVNLISHLLKLANCFRNTGFKDEFRPILCCETQSFISIDIWVFSAKMSVPTNEKHPKLSAWVTLKSEQS